MSGKILRQKWITRADLRNNPNRYYVFGDNMLRRGFGGQAKEMRGEPNAIGVPTKNAPGMSNLCFFSDEQWLTRTQDRTKDIMYAVYGAFVAIEGCLLQDYDVVIPTDGLGTGLSELQIRAPKIHKYIEYQIKWLEEQFGVEEI